MSFATLPTELRLRIIKESIEAQPAVFFSSSSSSTTHRPDLNVRQAIVLAQVSHSCHAIVAEMLYHTIRITRPSSLLELRAALEARPQLASLIFNLHIGATSELPQKGWPLTRERRPPNDLWCSIKTTLSEGELPPWCSPGTKFTIGHPEVSYPTICADNALQTAMRDIDVDPSKTGRSKLGQCIGTRVWARRLCLLQATLDVYLIEAKRLDAARRAAEASPQASIDDADRAGSCKTSTLEHYPRLLKVCREGPPAATSSNQLPRVNDFTTSVQQLWDAQLKRGGLADHFDHFVRLTRSTQQGIGMASKEEWRRVRRVLSGLDLREESGSGEQEREKEEDPESDYEDMPVGSVLPSSKERHPLDGHRVEDLLGAARYIMELTTNIQSLSLSSYFHRALASPTPPSSLRSLVVGPRTSYWDDVLPSVKCLSAFKNLTRLRVGGRITEDDAFKIAYEMPFLSEVEWEMPERSIESSSTIYDTVDLLQGLRWTEDEDASGESLEAGKATSANSSLTSYSEPSFSSRLTTIHLHPHIIIRVLGLALLEPGKRESWEKGRSVARTLHRVKIADSDVMSLPAKLAVWDETDFATLMKRSLEWWEEGARLA